MSPVTGSRRYASISSSWEEEMEDTEAGKCDGKVSLIHWFSLTEYVLLLYQIVGI